MKIIFHFIIAISLLGYSNDVQKGGNYNLMLGKDTIISEIIKDSILTTNESNIDSFPLSTKLIIYPLYEAFLISRVENQNPIKIIRFIPLSDSYRFSEHPDSLAIEDRHLGNITYTYDNYHTLESEYRSRFLASTGISESDQIYIYNIILDSIEIYKVNDIQVVAILSPYGAKNPVRQYDYMIGFEMKSCKLSEDDAHCLVYVGKSNPFNKGGLVPVSWKEIESKKFPATHLNPNDSIKYNRYGQPLKAYYFKHKGLEYFIQNYGKGNSAFGRHLVVISLDAQKVLFDKIYSGSEGSYLESLNGVGEAVYGTKQNQWTGKLFKNRPGVIFGFRAVSFGCRSIDFLDESEPAVYIRCDNRH